MREVKDITAMSVDERIAYAKANSPLTEEELQMIKEGSALTTDRADQMVENVIGVYFRRRHSHAGHSGMHAVCRSYGRPCRHGLASQQHRADRYIRTYKPRQHCPYPRICQIPRH